MCGTVVRRCSSVAIPLRVSSSTPISSSPRPSTSGARPTAPASGRPRPSRRRRSGRSASTPSSSTFVHCLPSWSAIPRLPNAFASSFAASASSCGISVSSISTTVTSLPKRWKIDANSQPMMPPPSTTSRCGTSVCASRPVESTQRGESRPVDRRADRERAGRDDRALERDVLPALDGDRVRALEAALALHPLDAVRLEEPGDAARHLLDDAVLPLDRRAEVELRLARR